MRAVGRAKLADLGEKGDAIKRGIRLVVGEVEQRLGMLEALARESNFARGRDLHSMASQIFGNREECIETVTKRSIDIYEPLITRID
jgi:hypothetical protein